MDRRQFSRHGGSTPAPTSLLRDGRPLTHTKGYDQTASNSAFRRFVTLNQAGQSPASIDHACEIESWFQQRRFSFSRGRILQPGHFSYGFAAGAGRVRLGPAQVLFRSEASIRTREQQSSWPAPPGNQSNASPISINVACAHSCYRYTSVDLCRISGAGYASGAASKYYLLATKKHDGKRLYSAT